MADQEMATGAATISAENLSRYHGLACGMVSATTASADAATVQRATQLPGMVLPARGLSLLVAHARQALEDEACRFDVQIPNEETALSRRTAALAGWCQGFLEGYALGARTDGDQALAADVAELIGDISRIGAELAEGEIDADEDNEQDFVEISEFVRVAVMNIYLSRTPEP